MDASAALTAFSTGNLGYLIEALDWDEKRTITITVPDGSGVHGISVRRGLVVLDVTLSHGDTQWDGQLHSHDSAEKAEECWTRHQADLSGMLMAARLVGAVVTDASEGGTLPAELMAPVRDPYPFNII